MAIGTGVSPTYKWSSRFPVIKNALTAVINSGAIPTTALTAGSNGSYTTTVAVTGEGAAVGDGVIAFPGTDLLGCTYTAHVSAANTIKVTITNCTGASQTPASSTWTFLVFYVGDNVGVGI